MTFIGRHSIKINRAQTMAATGPYGRTFAAMLAAIPDTVIEALTARQLADMIDAMQRLAEASKAIAAAQTSAKWWIETARNASFGASILSDRVAW